MKKILLVDLCIFGEEGGGHTEFYFMTILSILSEQYDLVYCCCGSNDRLKTNIKERVLKNCQVVDIEVKLTDKIFRRFLILLDFLLPKISIFRYLKFSSLINLTIVQGLISRIGKEIPVFFPYTDGIIPNVPLFISSFFFPKNWSGLHIIPSYQLKITEGHDQSRYRFYAEKNFQLPSCKTILVLHPLYQHFLDLRFKNLACSYLPELVDLKSLGLLENKRKIQDSKFLTQIKNNARERKIIAMLGNITSRKNLPLFLESVSKLNSEQYFILILGKLRIKHSSSLAKDQEKVESYRNLLHQNSYIDIEYFIKDEQEFSQLIDVSDILFNHYHAYPFSSSILTKAMAHRKPVIVNKGYLMEKIVNQYNWQVAVEENPNAIAKAIESITETNYQVPESSYQSFMEDHSPERFKSVILKACENLYESDT